MVNFTYMKDDCTASSHFVPEAVHIFEDLIKTKVSITTSKMALVPLRIKFASVDALLEIW